MSFLEESYFHSSSLLGVDEVGRGPLAGPVVSCCVGISLSDQERALEFLLYLKHFQVTDSKKLSKKKRLHIVNHFFPSWERILKSGGAKCSEFKDLKIQTELSFVQAKDIDEINIHQASLLAMKNAIEQTKFTGLVLVDGKFAPKVINECVPIIKGDSKSLLIGLASILAKEVRDHVMELYAETYPNYGLERHAGYPTLLHRQAIEKYGISPIHRKSFKGVREYS